MKLLLRLTVAATAFIPFSIAQYCGTCQSFGVDFLNGGSYFQNSESEDPFTALQQFEGCANDTSSNALVDPNGDQYECSMTPLQPDETPQLVECPLNKNQLFDGEYSILVLSNNGDCEPIVYQREFSLSVGPQQTSTVSPTVVVSSTETPVETTMQTVTKVVTKTLDATTTTVPRATLTPTITIRPLPVITVVTRAVFTVTKTKDVANVVSTKTVTTTPTCKPARRRRVPDPVARIAATVFGDLFQRDAMPAPTARSASTEFKRAILEGRAVDPEIKARFLLERRERLALQKRAPDLPTTTITDGEGTPVTSTIVYTAPTTTITGTTTAISTVTSTPTVTVSRGYSVTVKKVTAARQTLTLTKWKPVTTVRVTRTQNVVLSVTETSTPAGASVSCAAKGGTLS